MLKIVRYKERVIQIEEYVTYHLLWVYYYVRQEKRYLETNVWFELKFF